MAMSWSRFKEILEAKGVTNDTMIEWIDWDSVHHGETNEPEIKFWKQDEPIIIE